MIEVEYKDHIFEVDYSVSGSYYPRTEWEEEVWPEVEINKVYLLFNDKKKRIKKINENLYNRIISTIHEENINLFIQM